MDAIGFGDPVPARGCYHPGELDLGTAGAADSFLQMFDGYHSTYVCMEDG